LSVLINRFDFSLNVLARRNLDIPLEVLLGEVFSENGWTISVADTTAGGLISASFVSVPGCSAYFDRGVVVYSRASKTELMGISDEELTQYGSVSEETARTLADRIRKISGTTLGVAETGIAGPIAGRSPKPVGTVYIAVAGPKCTRCNAFAFDGCRSVIRGQIVAEALKMVRHTISDQTFWP